MTFASLTPSALTASLEKLASASTEDECAVALVSAAGMIQEAVLVGQSQESFHDALDACPNGLGEQLKAVLDRSVNFHLLAEGGMLGLWMLPVAINSNHSLPATIDLERTTLNALKMSGCLLEQLELSKAKTGGDRSGWTCVLPTLYSDVQIRNADIGELVRLPHEARDIIRGDVQALSFSAGPNTGDVEPGVQIYYLPFVAFAPQGVPPTLPLGSAKTTARLTQWVNATLAPTMANEFALTVGQLPQPFTLALRVGDRLRTEVVLRESMHRICASSGVEPNGLAALVAPYSTATSDETFMVGVSLVSRLTQNVVATLSLPVVSEAGQEEVALATHILNDMGMDCIQDFNGALQTSACQHCGKFQYALPNVEVAGNKMAAPAANVH
jgi:hypothetical protein